MYPIRQRPTNARFDRREATVYHYDPAAADDSPALIVDLADLGLILTRLERLHIGVNRDDIDEEPILHLARIPVDIGPLATAPETDRAIDSVVSLLRADIEGDFGGWAPEMDADRAVECIVGFPQTKPMADVDLVPADIGLLNWPEASSTAGEGVRIGILDTGLFLHELFREQVVAFPLDLYTPPPGEAVRPGQGHACFIAGRMARQAPAATIVPRRVLGPKGTASVWNTARALASFQADHVDIINVSLGYRARGGHVAMALRRAVDLASRTSLIVAAAGNHGVPAPCQVTRDNAPTKDEITASVEPMWPAALSNVVAVGAAARIVAGSDIVDLAEFTPRLPWVDCVAPGYALLSTYLYADVLDLADTPGPNVTHCGAARWSGSSFAAADTSGAVAARTQPGRVTAAEALAQLLDESGPVVRRYHYRG
jgi:membrane-anchored mycosin MYCP